MAQFALAAGGLLDSDDGFDVYRSVLNTSSFIDQRYFMPPSASALIERSDCHSASESLESPALTVRWPNTLAIVGILLTTYVSTYALMRWYEQIGSRQVLSLHDFSNRKTKIYSRFDSRISDNRLSINATAIRTSPLYAPMVRLEEASWDLWERFKE